MSEHVLKSLSTLHTRCEAIPALLESVLALPLPDVEITRAQRVLVTGAGLAEGPARLLAAQWRAQLGVCADFVPLTAFLTGAPREADVLIVCSQGICPNARLALATLESYPVGILLSSVRLGSPPLPEDVATWMAGGGIVWDLPPADESGGFLIRVQGPTLYTLAISRWTAHLYKMHEDGDELSWVSALARVPRAYEERFDAVISGREHTESAPLSLPNLALLSYGNNDDLSQGLRWKLLEGLWRQAPPVFDLLQIVHGPWQGFYHEQMTLLALVDVACPVQHELLRRLESMLQPRHTLIRVTTSLPSPLGYFEFAAYLDAMILMENRRRGVDLVAWPGRGEDGPLYTLSCNPSP